MERKKVYVVGKSITYANWLNMSLTDSIEEADIVMFRGGEDVSPTLYGDKIGAYTQYNRKRDIYEVEEFKKAFELGKHMIGICRGAQLLCVLAGGTLVQHQQNEHSYHPIVVDNDGTQLVISSTHHQSQYPYNMDKDKYKVLAYTPDDIRSRYHLNGDNVEISDQNFKEVEIAYYPEIKALAIQGHPEYLVENRKKYNDTLTYLMTLLNNHLNDKL